MQTRAWFSTTIGSDFCRLRDIVGQGQGCLCAILLICSIGASEVLTNFEDADFMKSSSDTPWERQRLFLMRVYSKAKLLASGTEVVIRALQWLVFVQTRRWWRLTLIFNSEHLRQALLSRTAFTSNRRCGSNLALSLFELLLLVCSITLNETAGGVPRAWNFEGGMLGCPQWKGRMIRAKNSVLKKDEMPMAQGEGDILCSASWMCCCIRPMKFFVVRVRLAGLSCVPFHWQPLNATIHIHTEETLFAYLGAIRNAQLVSGHRRAERASSLSRWQELTEVRAPPNQTAKLSKKTRSYVVTCGWLLSFPGLTIPGTA